LGRRLGGWGGFRLGSGFGGSWWLAGRDRQEAGGDSGGKCGAGRWEFHVWNGIERCVFSRLVGKCHFFLFEAGWGFDLKKSGWLAKIVFGRYRNTFRVSLPAKEEINRP